MVVKKSGNGKWDIFIGKDRVQVAQIVDERPDIKYTINKYKSFLLWVKVGERYYQHKISWFYRISDFIKYVREIESTIGWSGFLNINGLDKKTYTKAVKTLKETK
jgi:hypothetical protein